MRKSNFYLRAGTVLLALLLALMLAACGSDDNGDTDAGAQPEETSVETGGSDDETAAPGEGASQVVVTAKEFEFDVEDTLPAGSTTFNFVNEGKQPHEFSLVKFTEDAPPIEELLQLPEQKAGKYFEEETGHAFAKPGESQEGAFTAELTAGTYGYVCFVQDPKTKKPHAFLGMNGTFTVE